MLKNKVFALFFCLIFLCAFHLSFAKDWQRGYLTSFPQSGNHWVRYLVEEASQIATSSVYCDPEPPKHMNKIFPWGGYCCDHGYEGNCRYPTKDDLVLIKTHFPYPHTLKTQVDLRPCQLIIRIVRHPVDSFYSRYTKLPRGSLQNKMPSFRVKELIERWHKFQTYWNKQKNVVTIRYEDILENPFVELKRICAILNYEVTDEDIARAVAKYPPEGYMLKHIEKFRRKDLRLISEELSSLLLQFDYEIPF